MGRMSHVLCNCFCTRKRWFKYVSKSLMQIFYTHIWSPVYTHQKEHNIQNNHMEGVELKKIWVNKVKCQHISKLGTLLKKTFTWHANKNLYSLLFLFTKDVLIFSKFWKWFLQYIFHSVLNIRSTWLF